MSRTRHRAGPRTTSERRRALIIFWSGCALAAPVGWWAPHPAALVGGGLSILMVCAMPLARLRLATGFATGLLGVLTLCIALPLWSSAALQAELRALPINTTPSFPLRRSPQVLELHGFARHDVRLEWAAKDRYLGGKMARDVTESAVPFTFTRDEPVDWTSALVFETSVPDDNGSKAPRAFSGLVVARRLGPPPDWRHFGFEGTASRTIRRLGGQPEHAWRLRPFHPEETWLDAIAVLYGLAGGLHLLILNSTTQRGTTLTPPLESD